ncbi:MAG: hypothetical protein KDD94_11595 [Calditrichaeota bacterium]|nr:hypothetical protein [Calditrichota bacterium]
MNILIYLLFSITLFFAQNDTITVSGNDLNIRYLRNVKSQYVSYYKKNTDSSPEKITLINFDVQLKTLFSRRVIEINQQWNMDTLIHKATSVLDQSDFSTLLYEYYWKRSGYSVKFDFLDKVITYDKPIPESQRLKVETEFKKSLAQNTLNWHSDIVLLPLLDFKENRVFKITFYEAGFGDAQDVIYTVIGTEELLLSSGKRVVCWLLENKEDSQSANYSRFWISKESRELMKEEDFFGRYRYKLKLLIADGN